MNADGDKYNNGVIYYFIDRHWLITSGMDIKMAKSSNTYDLIIINDAIENNFINVGIINNINVLRAIIIFYRQYLTQMKINTVSDLIKKHLIIRKK